MGDSESVYCAWERKRFPADHFEPREGHGLVHFLDVSEPHTTSGLPLASGGGGGGSGGPVDEPAGWRRGGTGGGWSAPADVPLD